jgi:hypothetical protein
VDKLRALIERLLPWYDPEREAAKDRRAEDITRRVRRETALRRSFHQADDRLSGRAHR